MNELEEFLSWVAGEKRKEEEQELAKEVSLGRIAEELSMKVRNAVTLRHDFEKIGNARASAYWQGYGDGIEEIKELVLQLRHLVGLLEQTKERLEQVKDKAVLRKEVDIEIDLTWSIAEINEVIGRLKA